MSGSPPSPEPSTSPPTPESDASSPLPGPFTSHASPSALEPFTSPPNTKHSASPPVSEISTTLSSSSAFTSEASTSSSGLNPSTLSRLPSPAPPHNYILRISLCPLLIKNPPIIRTLSLPASTTFPTLHRAIQLSFGWAFLHTHSFQIGDSNPDPHAPSRWPFLTLVPPPSCHRRYWPRLKDGILYAHKTHLWEVFETELLASEPLWYEYDAHSRWEHTVELVGREARRETIRCVSGSGHAAGENGHGPVVWEVVKGAYRKRDWVRRWGVGGLTAEEEGWIRWYEEYCETGDGEGLGGRGAWVWDRVYVNRVLAGLPGEVDREERFW